MQYKELNGIKIAYENIKDTPRCAIYLYLTTNKEIPHKGAHVLLGNLLLQGTNKKTAEQIATELENLGIEVTIDSRVDFLKVSIVCLNEDLDSALDIVSDFMLNATFDTFDKEVFKFRGETISSLDSPVTKASDAFIREIFKNHKYGTTNTVILENLDKMTVEHVKDHYGNLLKGGKIISIAADISDENAFLEKITSKLYFMKDCSGQISPPASAAHKEGGFVKMTKNDAQQAQIFQGWLTGGITSKDCAALTVLNNILGASGLSSRLFVELRDKKGLAYTVRSSYKYLKDAAYFMLYIGTDPSNIKQSLEGFKTEIERVIKEPPDEIELQGAIENYIGKYKYFYTQTNSQIASSNGWNGINNAGFDFGEKLTEEVKKVTSDDIIKVTKKYLLKPPVTVILAPEKFLNF